MPPTKLTPPTSPMTIRNPVPDSERCGVMIAEKSVGSEFGSLSGGFVRSCCPQYRANMARKRPSDKTPTQTGEADSPRRRKLAQAARQGGQAQAAEGAGQGRPARPCTASMPPWTKAEIEEAFRRFQAAMPEPKGELQHINPFTLLVAVVLSAQATDAGVNKATPALFALADTPEKMAALGEAKVRDLIKTIGLFRTKAKNVIALSQQLVAEHGGQVPRTREALEALPGVGRKTANVVLNIAFGEPTIAVDTHIFRIGNRTGLAPGKNPLEVELKLLEVVPDALQAATPITG